MLESCVLLLIVFLLIVGIIALTFFVVGIVNGKGNLKRNKAFINNIIIQDDIYSQEEV